MGVKKAHSPSRMLVIAKGRISGTYADGFHHLSEEGKTGYYLDRDPSPEERQTMLTDIARHRDRLIDELIGLQLAEKILLAM